MTNFDLLGIFRDARRIRRTSDLMETLNLRMDHYA